MSDEKRRRVFVARCVGCGDRLTKEIAVMLNGEDYCIPCRDAVEKYGR